MGEIVSPPISSQLTAPSLHTLPHDELGTKLRSQTNLRDLFDDDHPEGCVAAVERLPAWGGPAFRHLNPLP